MKKRKDIILPHKDHELVTRRDFLGQGLVAGIGYTVTPSLLGMLYSQQAFGAEGCVGPDIVFEQKTPVIIIDLAGGGNIPGSNVLVGDQAGQHSFIPSYGRLGIPDNFHPKESGMVNNEMGLKFHSKSGMLDGIRNVTSAQIRQKVEGGVFAAISNDDTGNNPHNPVYWLNKAGAMGRLAQTTGTRASRSGARSKVPSLSYDPLAAPVQISRPQDAVELITLGRVHQNFDNNKAQKILKAIENMSEAKLAQFSQQSLPDQIKQVAECGFAKAPIDKLVHNNAQDLTAQAIDPRNDSDVRGVYTNLDNNRDQQKEASIAKMVLDGYIGAGTIELGGFDYHNRDRNDTDGRDRRAGEAIGRIMALAARKQKDVMIYVFTDGGISSNMNTQDGGAAEGKYRFTNDDGQRASTFMLYYKHSARPTLYSNAGSFDTRKRQVGYFKSNSAVEKAANALSNNVVNLAKAVTLNYLAIHGEESKFEEVVGDNPFGSNMDDYIIFGKNS